MLTAADFRSPIRNLSFFCVFFLNRKQHKTHPKLQQLLESNAAASHAFPRTPNGATQASENQEMKSQSFN